MRKTQPQAVGDPPFTIETEAQLEALLSPIRQEIVDALSSAGPSTVAELGRLLQRAPDSLYPHLEPLVAAGLVVERAPLRDKRHIAAVMDLPGRPIFIDYAKLGHSPLLPKVIERALKLSLRDYGRTLRGDAPAHSRKDGLPMGGRVKGWLNEAELEAVRHHLESIRQMLNNGRPGDGRKPYALGFVLSPASGTRRKS